MSKRFQKKLSERQEKKQAPQRPTMATSGARDDMPDLFDAAARGPRLVRLDLIRTDGETQPREQMMPDTIEEYAEAMRFEAERSLVVDLQNKPWPALEAVRDEDDHYWLVDGFHRLAAARQVGLEFFQAEVTPGTRRDAIRRSLGVNASHGQRRTRQDLQRAIERALRDEEWGRWSNANIARLCHTTAKTVAAHRERLERAREIPFYPLLTSSDGRQYERDRPAWLKQPSSEGEHSAAGASSDAEEADHTVVSVSPSRDDDAPAPGARSSERARWRDLLARYDEESLELLIAYPEARQDWRALARHAPRVLTEDGLLITPLYSRQRALLEGLTILCDEEEGPFPPAQVLYIPHFKRFFWAYALAPTRLPDAVVQEVSALQAKEASCAALVLGNPIDDWSKALSS